MRQRILPVATLCLAGILAGAGCDSSLPLLDNPGSDWAQREQDRNDAGNLIDDILDNPKGLSSGSYGATGLSQAPPIGLGRGEEAAVWSETAQAWLSAGTTTRNGVAWEWTFLLRNVASDGAVQQLPDGSTERIDVVLTADGARTFEQEGVVTEQQMSWLLLGEITGMGSGTLDVAVTGVFDGEAVRASEVTELPGELRVAVTVPEDTDDCPSGDYTLRIADFTVTGTFAPTDSRVDWSAYAGDIEEGEEPFETGSDPFECEGAP